MDPQYKYNVAYHQSRDPRIQRLREKQSHQLRKTLGLALAAALPVDAVIDVDGADAWIEMKARANAGMASMPSLALGLNAPAPFQIPTVTNPDMLVSFQPPRRFTVSDYFDTVRALNGIGVYTGNPQNPHRFVMPCDAEEATIDILETLTYGQSPEQPGFLLHFGIVINGIPGGLVVDAEEIALALRVGPAEVQKFIADRTGGFQIQVKTPDAPAPTVNTGTPNALTAPPTA